VWGLQTTDVEGLTTLADEDVTFFYNASGEEDVFAAGLSGNAIWTSFGFVEQDRVHKLPEGIWTFGGPRSCQQFIDAMLQVYAA
jgi:ferric hydroxamate transport system substrate-binding protein